MLIVCHENDKLERLICHDSARLSSFANGNGTPHSYWRRLLQRMQQEMQICERTRRELEVTGDQFRNLGIKLISLEEPFLFW